MRLSIQFIQDLSSDVAPPRQEPKYYVDQQQLVFEFGYWNQGSYFQVTLKEQRFPENEGPYWKEKTSVTFYDKHYMAYKEIMDMLTSGEIRGPSAISSVYKLLWNIVLPSEFIQQVLPLYYQYYKTHEKN